MRRSLWPNPLSRSLRAAAACLCLPLLATNPAPAQTTNPTADTEQLRQAELRQTQIRQQTQLAAEQLDQIITDFETNGLGEGDDVKLLRQLHGMLGRLTSEQMQQVIVLLQQARATPDTAVPTARDAYDRQQRILVEFRRVLAEYQKTQSTYALAARVRQLMERQQMALRASIDLADALGEKLTAEPDARARESLAVQATEQQALAGELDDLLRQLATLAATPAAPGASLQTDSARLSQALALARELGTLDTMRQAGSHLQQNALFRAGNLQRDSRDGLRKIWRQVGPPRDRLQQLSDAALELQQHLEMQTAVRQLTASAPDKPAYLATKRRQGDLIDRTGMTQSDLETLLPTAADLTRDALREMRRARQRIDQNEKSAPQSQTAAYDLLVKARDEVLAAITEEQTRQDQQASRPLQDRLERVEEALKQVEELKKKQDALATTPPTPSPAPNSPPNTPPNTPPNSPPTPAHPTSRAEQAKLESESRELAAQISSDNPAAARELSEAAQDMRNAQQQMRDAPNEPSAPRADQQQASQDLQQAKQELERQAQELRDAQAQLDRVTAAQERVDQIMQQQAQASQSAADAAQNPTPESQQQQSQRAAEQQQQARDATTAAQEQVRQASPEAAQSMRQAPAPMSEAQKDLQADKPAEARPDQNRAEQALAETQDQLARDADRLREQLDQPSDDALQAERAAQAMKAAAESAQNAEQQMGQEKSPTEPSASEMAKQAQSLESSDAKNGQATPAQTRSAMQSAAEELRQGASAARAGNRPQAAQAAQRAREQLAQGQRALEEAQARAAELAQQQSQSSLQPSQQQNPNSKDGQNPSPNQADPNRNAQAGGPRSNEDGSSSFLGLPARDRQALQQSQSEKYPEEYSAIVEQYLRNLSQRPK